MIQLMALACLAFVANEPAAPTNSDTEVIIGGVSEASFPEISVDFQVKHPDGTPLLDAQEPDFRVTEYGEGVPTVAFQSPTQVHATTIVLVVDHSGSMRDEDRIGGLKRAVATFLTKLPPGSRVAVVAFGSTVDLLCPFTDDTERIQTAVDSLRPIGATRYYDAVAEALELIGQEQGRRAVLALTDGEDTFSQVATIDQVILAARRVGVPIYTLGLGSEAEIQTDALRRLAVETRGRYYPAREAEQLKAVYEEVARGLGSSYRLTYRSARELPDGTLRPIRIAYRASLKAGEATVFIPGMVVPAAGWPVLFLILIGALAALAIVPGRLARAR
ncbi:MAG: VWA domain-containing protein [Isosphaeraceae bacterium]